MKYITERITNISELEKIIEHSYFLAQKLLNKSPENDRFKELVYLLKKAQEFEFCVERRKSTYKDDIALTIPFLINGEILCRGKYKIQGKPCGRDADGVFHCECGQCRRLNKAFKKSTGK